MEGREILGILIFVVFIILGAYIILKPFRKGKVKYTPSKPMRWDSLDVPPYRYYPYADDSFDDFISDLYRKKELKMANDPNIGKEYWHIHHEVLHEPLTEPVKNREEAIRRKGESPERIFTRLFLMRPVAETPDTTASKEAADRARRNRDAAYAAYVKGELSRQGYEVLNQKWNKAANAAKVDWEALHKAQCDPQCPWDGHTIFPAKPATKVAASY